VDSVQVDPLNVVGHNQDLALWGRIVGYRASDLEDALYRRRTVFEWGGNIQIRPIEELPYLRIVMTRKIAEERWRRFARTKTSLLRRVIKEITNRGPLSTRDFSGADEVRVRNYRGRKEAALALYYLWLKGDLMIASRRRGEKVFDLARRVYPRVAPSVSGKEAEDHLILQTLRHLGLATDSEWLAYAHTRIGRSTLRWDWADMTRRWMERGIIQEQEVEGWSGRRWMLAEGAADLETIRSSGIPSAWRPRSTTTEEEAVFLAPLEFTIARGRAAELFDFEYVWEVYKPAGTRRWGYYTLPVLFGASLCARIELRYDPMSHSLRVLGFWPERPSVRRDPAFAAGLGRALARLADFHEATEVDASGLKGRKLELDVQGSIKATREGNPERPAS
jgi:uncharacterized protein YcaQ